MKNKIKNFKIFWFLLPGLILFIFAVNTYGSGTYAPPLPPSWDIGAVFYEDVKQGKKLFEGTQLTGEGGKTCYVCHAQGQMVPLKRSSLKNKVNQLSSEINDCLADPTRSAGSQIKDDSTEMIQLELFLISLYHLPNETVKYNLNKK